LNIVYLLLFKIEYGRIKYLKPSFLFINKTYLKISQNQLISLSFSPIQKNSYFSMSFLKTGYLMSIKFLSAKKKTFNLILQIEGL